MNDTLSLQDAYDDAVAHLSRAGSPTPDLDATLLVEHATGLTALDRLTRPGQAIEPRRLQTLRDALARRMAHEPVHRIIGRREFYGLPLALNAHTLVPRPDTETLVDLVLPFVRERAAGNGRCRILDLGTGSGAIALAILKQVPEAVATGTDISAQALDMASANAAALGLVDRFTPLVSDWFAHVGGEFDLIVANPPYVPTATIATLDPDVRDHDPLRALDGGTDGLNAYAIIAHDCIGNLAPGGRVAVEIGAGQKPDVRRIFADHGFKALAVARDLNGRDRALFFAP
ncbi:MULTISPECIES: peptide chain release factor N(5)-glutamine methyltransferase [unclassified Roseitalea]|uniref:peptide chain release factor N(5)-glutamine methyltransferase n=1 Tax=unclassified Roseitalea TaxID=2639107 RepID=UPI00273EA0C3|nr:MULTISPECIES: peptide chain release factor N(5)-glutamine methyltransferase [unclassified Roseitalea]